VTVSAALPAEVDGVEIPNTNIASNPGPQIDPKDIDYLEIERGSYSVTYSNQTVLNLTDKHLLIDNSLTLDGFHWNYPRQIYAGLNYRFGY
jgi:hypothetical protein